MSLDELDDADVRARLAAVRRRAARDALNAAALTPLGEGVTPPPINAAPPDAFGRGPGSPFYDPTWRPPWAPDWQPGDGRPPEPSDDDGIEWRFQ